MLNECLTSDTSQSNAIKCRKKKSPTFEKLQIITNSLSEIGSNETLIKDEKIFNLNPEKVKSALDSFLGGNDGLAYCILDESGNLFSSSLFDEANASLTCLKKIQSIVLKEEGEVLSKPLIVITGKSHEDIKCVLLMPKEFQSNEKSTNHCIIYSLDPLNGKRNLIKQTKNKLFEMYLRNGDVQSGIKPLFRNGIEASENQSDVIRKEAKEAASGWWSLFYCLMLIYEGNDSFLKRIEWEKSSVNIVANILSIHIDALNKDEVEEIKETQIVKIDIKSLKNVDDEIKTFFNVRERVIHEKINEIQNSNIDEKLKQLQSEENSIQMANETLKQEIKEIELIIKEGEMFLSSKKSESVDTTDAKYKRFITGEEKRLIEAKIEKKGEKSREAIFSHNENERNKFIEEQINVWANLVLDEDKKIKEKNEKIAEATKVISVCNEKIEFEEKTIKNCNTQLTTSTQNKVASEAKKKGFDDLKNNLNSILIDTNYSEMIKRLSNKDVEYDKNEINSIKDLLGTCDKNINTYKSSITSAETTLDKNTNEISDKQVLITSRTNLISETKNKSVASDKISYYSEKVEAYSGIWRWVGYDSDYNGFLNSLNDWKSTQQEENRTIEKYRTEIKSFQTSIDKLEKENVQLNANKSNFETSLEREKLNLKNAINKLKSLRGEIINKTLENIKNVEKQISIFNIEITNSNNGIKNAQANITRLKEEIKLKNSEIEKLKLTLKINEDTKIKISEKIDKAKVSLAVRNYFYII